MARTSGGAATATATLQIPMRTFTNDFTGDTSQYNPLVLVRNFAEPQIFELDVEKSAEVLYIHIMGGGERSRMGHATGARECCEATGGDGAGGGARGCLYRVSQGTGLVNVATSRRACALALV